MNNKAQKFKNYLDEKEIKVFEVEEIGDEQATVAFRSRITISGQNLPTIVLIDNSDYSMVRVQIAPNVINGENQSELLKFTNDETAKYKPFKLFFNENGDLLLDFCIDANEEIFSGEKVYNVFDIIINYLENNYRNIMKVIWK
jgi:hypothetical protein